MSMTFAKLFTSITESTIWIEDDHTRIVWITMLAMADRRGRVWGSVPGLANRARVPVESARTALGKFLSPDADSRTKDNEGRRIEEIDGGWRLLNYEKFRAIRDEEAILESKRKHINTKRAKQRVVDGVDRCRHNAEAEAEAPTSLPLRSAAPQDVSNEGNSEFKLEDQPASSPSRQPAPKKEKVAPKEKSGLDEAALLTFLNDKAGKKFRAIPSNLSLIRARLDEPEVTADGCRKMIERQIAMWSGDRMEEYLRPATLFGKEKFSSYYDSRDLPLPSNGVNGHLKGRVVFQRGEFTKEEWADQTL